MGVGWTCDPMSEQVDGSLEMLVSHLSHLVSYRLVTDSVSKNKVDTT